MSKAESFPGCSNVESDSGSASSRRIEDVVADAVLAKYDTLPPKYKPSRDAAGRYNWVPLSGIVFVNDAGSVDVVSVATGMKCLPSTAIPDLSGIVLHDSHAEILALRYLNHFLQAECYKVASTKDTTAPYESSYIQLRDVDERSATPASPQPFTIRRGWKIYMHCSEAPCGDASMELVMAKQDDATPWSVPSVTGPITEDPTSNDSGGSVLLGRGYFSQLGAVRRKPARADSPPTLSKSCTDKLALKQCTGLLSSITSLLIMPESAYLHTLVLPASQYVPAACERAFGGSGRMGPVVGASWEGGYGYHPFEVATTSREFRFSRRSLVSMGPRAETDSKPSNLASGWSPCAVEVMINGILQGRKKGDVRGASVASRRKMVELSTSTVIALWTRGVVADQTAAKTYTELKACQALQDRRKVKGKVQEEALRGWVRNEPDDFVLASPSGVAQSKKESEGLR